MSGAKAMAGFEPRDAALVGAIALFVFMALKAAFSRAPGRSGQNRRGPATLGTISSGTPYRRPWGLRRLSGAEQERDLAAAAQLHAIMAASFEKKRILSLTEYRAFRIIESEVIAARRGYRVFAQTCLGEILASSCQDAFRSINSKRTDILIVDPACWPVLAVEYQGSGHYQGTAVARDTIKREALRRAGVGYLDIFDSDGDDQIRLRLRQQLGWEIIAPATSGASPS